MQWRMFTCWCRHGQDGADQVRAVLAANGFDPRPPVALTGRDLRMCPTTWAKRLAFGRDPRALYLDGTRKAEALANNLSLAVGKLLTG